MRITAPATLLLAALALAACGSNPSKPAETAPAAAAKAETQAEKEARLAAAKDKRANCEKFTPIGSNRPQYRCFSAAEKKARDEEAAREMRKSTGVGNGD